MGRAGTLDRASDLISRVEAESERVKLALKTLQAEKEM